MKWEEIVKLMYGKELNYCDCHPIDVIYSLDKAHRYVILKTDIGYLTYQLESIALYDEEELKYFPHSDEAPAYWRPCDNLDKSKSIFDDIKSLMRELRSQSEYKIYFEIKEDEE